LRREDEECGQEEKAGQAEERQPHGRHRLRPGTKNSPAPEAPLRLCDEDEVPRPHPAHSGGHSIHHRSAHTSCLPLSLPCLHIIFSCHSRHSNEEKSGVHFVFHDSHCHAMLNVSAHTSCLPSTLSMLSAFGLRMAIIVEGRVHLWLVTVFVTHCVLGRARQLCTMLLQPRCVVYQEWGQRRFSVESIYSSNSLKHSGSRMYDQSDVFRMMKNFAVYNGDAFAP
jgi:hypothetical protein